MKQTKILMGMPITVQIEDDSADQKTIDTVYTYFDSIDRKFSTYIKNSEISKLNQGIINKNNVSDDTKQILQLCEDTRLETNGFFSIYKNGKIDPSGLVKGWAIFNASNMLLRLGMKNHYIDAGGDIQIQGLKNNKKWTVGIQNPFDMKEIIKVLHLTNKGIATSGTYIRGKHIYNPHNGMDISEIVSLTVIAENIYEADRFATAAFAMGKEGINFIEHLKGFEGYIIDKHGIATYTSGFEHYTQ